MKNRCQHTVVLRLIILFTTCLLVTCYIGLNLIRARTEGEKRAVAAGEEKINAAQAKAAFRAAYAVFSHPRCVNCHPAGDAPLQGDDSRTHFYRARRGEDGNGLYSMKCTNCHQAANQPGLNAPPGAPHLPKDGVTPGTPRWHLPSAKTPMIFQGRTPSRLCLQLKDRKQNGGLKIEEIIKHIESDPLVLWAWNPGEGRTKPPLSHDEFVRKMKEWAEKGGACPN